VCGWRGRPALPPVRGTALAGSGDMMIDRVVPLGCGRAGLSRLSASRVYPGRGGEQEPCGAPATGDGHGAAVALGPPLPPASASPARHGGVSLVAEAAQDVVGAAGELAGDRQRGPVGIGPVRRRRRNTGSQGISCGNPGGRPRIAPSAFPLLCDRVSFLLYLLLLSGVFALCSVVSRH
jgi:hypothetical protein